MDKRTQNLIERHFFNHSVNPDSIASREREIIEAGMAVDPGRIVVAGGRGDPTTEKAMKILGMRRHEGGRKSEWGGVVQSVFDAYHALRPDIHTVMVAKYQDGATPVDISKKYAHPNTIKKWRKVWLNVAYNLAVEKGLLKK